MSIVNPGIGNPSASSAVVTEPVEATTIGSGALPDDTTVNAAMGGEPVGRSVSASLSSRGGRYIVIALCLLWTIPTFGLLVSSALSMGMLYGAAANFEQRDF
jgi:hypothetical protein